MHSRLISISLLYQEKLVPSNKNDIFYKGIREICLSYDNNVSSDIYDLILEEYALTTGEKRNHFAVKCHVEKNKSHPMETLTLHGRLNIVDSKINTKKL